MSYFELGRSTSVLALETAVIELSATRWQLGTSVILTINCGFLEICLLLNLLLLQPENESTDIQIFSIFFAKKQPCEKEILTSSKAADVAVVI